MGTSYRSALSRGGNLTAVELVGEVFDAFELFHEDPADLRANPRSRLVVSDGRGFLHLTRGRFNGITVDRPRLEFDLLRSWRAGLAKGLHRSWR